MWRRRFHLDHAARGSHQALAGAARCLLGGESPAPRRRRGGNRRLRADFPARRLRHRDRSRHGAAQAEVADRRPRRRRQFPLLATVRRRRPRRDGARRGVHASAGRARPGDGRHLHRRAWHRPGQAEIPQGRTRPGGHRRHARGEGRRSIRRIFSIPERSCRRCRASIHKSIGSRQSDRGIQACNSSGHGDVVVRQKRAPGDLGRGNPVADRRYRGGVQDPRDLPICGRQRREGRRTPAAVRKQKRKYEGDRYERAAKAAMEIAMKISDDLLRDASLARSSACASRPTI